MATTKPRITVTFEPRTYEVLSRFSRAGGQSMSQVVADIIQLAVPSFERVVVVMERAAAAPQEVRDGMRQAIEKADQTLVPRLLESLDQSDMFLSGLGAEVAPPVGADAADAPRRAAAGRRPDGAGALGRPSSGGLTPVPLTGGSGLVKLPGSGPKGGRRGRD